MIERGETIELLKRLVATDSVNPSLVAGARGEGEVARCVCGWLRERGIAAELEPVANAEGVERPNVVATLPAVGSNHKPALMLVAHIDTVGAGGMPQPFTPREENGKLFGRGALDIKSGVAAICAAAASLAHDKLQLKRPLLLAMVVDEECNSIGAEALVQRHTADAAVVIEPTDLRLCIAHKGYAWLEIETRGRAAHGSSPRDGRDAIRYMGRVLAALEELERRLTAHATHPLLGTASLHASIIHGGHELSSYPAVCSLQIERRTLPGESDAEVEREIQQILEALRAADADFDGSVRLMSSRPPYAIASEHPLVAAASRALGCVTGSAEQFGMAVWTDTALLGAAGIPGVVLGPSGRGLHGRDEFVELDSVMQTAEVLRALALDLCGAN